MTRMLNKIKADKEDAAALDTAQVLFQTALIESGYELADASALVQQGPKGVRRVDWWKHARFFSRMVTTHRIETNY